MKSLILFLISFAVMAENPIVQTDCRYEYLPDGDSSSSEIYSIRTFRCSEGDEDQIKHFPAKVFKEFKQEGPSYTSTIYDNGVAREQKFVEYDIVFTRQHYYIPECKSYENTWRYQLAAMGEDKENEAPQKAINQVFFEKIEEVLTDCNLQNNLISSWHFCKTSGESFGSHENPGLNTTSRLYLQLDQFDMKLVSSDARQDLVNSCHMSAESELGSRLQSCIQVKKDPKYMIIPPKAFVNKHFNVLNTKFQFENCNNLESSPHLVPRT